MTTGQDRAQALQADKAAANAKTYAGLPDPNPSRQVVRRTVRVAVAHQVAAAKKAAIKNRRQKVGTNV